MKKILLLLSATLLFSCAQGTSNVNPVNSDNSVIKVQSVKNGVDLKLNVNFPSFSTKASTNGVAAKLWTDVRALKVYLTTNNLAPTTNIVAGSSNLFTYAAGLPAATKTYTFSNVPAGTYYAVVEAYSDIAGTTSIVEGGTTIPANFVSSNSGTVTAPAMTYSFSAGSAFAVTVKLANAIGANLDSNVTVTSGNNLPGTNATVNVQ